MRPPRYPLQPLAEVRGRAVDAALEELASSVRTREAASQRADAAAKRRDAHRADADQVRQDERRGLAAGQRTARDLGIAHAWESRITAEQRVLEGDVSRAQADERAAGKEEDGARVRLGERRAEERVVVGDRARWQDAVRAQREAREEEASLEGWRPPESR